MTFPFVNSRQTQIVELTTVHGELTLRRILDYDRTSDCLVCVIHTVAMDEDIGAFALQLEDVVRAFGSDLVLTMMPPNLYVYSPR
jgi:hypothetical protein